jgi:hypothetical protein
MIPASRRLEIVLPAGTADLVGDRLTYRKR